MRVALFIVTFIGMKYLIGNLLIAGLTVLVNSSIEPVRPIKQERTYEFLPDFKFGAASAAYQIEGGWNVDGKSPSIWDTFTHSSGKIKDNSNGDVSADSYNLYQKDVDALKETGVRSMKLM